ncbi:MAG: NahK/ErcS family hybrid sensor histidine kinase/response regulator [Spongiibacteraceae bacterium]
MDSQLLLLYASIYGALLFYVAWYVERHGLASPRWQPLVYSLSLAVYCSSWTFLGAVGRAVEGGWSFLPIYLGPILLFIFGWHFIRHLLVISSRNKVTSIADFIGSRYGKSQRLAALVTIVAVIGSLPYIALQLKAVSLVWSTINIDSLSETFTLGENLLISNGTSLISAMVLAWFAIVFGTRVIEGPRRHQGLIASIAVESIVKLVAFFALGVFAVQILLRDDFQLSLPTTLLTGYSGIDLKFFTQILLSMTAIVCLPRQFHVMAVEHHTGRDVRTARWLLPAYLMLFSLFIIPIALVSQTLLAGGEASADSYVLLLPMAENNPVLTTLVFIGALSAATGMVIVATLTLSIMISNELIVPLWLNLHTRARTDFGNRLRLARRSSIIVLLLLAWMLEYNFRESDGLSSMGLISFAAAAQMAPSVVAGLYWLRGHRNGVFAGISIGLAVWFYCLLLPALLPADDSLIIQGPWQISWLSPTNILGFGGMDTLSHGVFWSLLLNGLSFFVISKLSRFNALDLRQAKAFNQMRQRYAFRQKDFELTEIEVRQLQALIRPLQDDVSNNRLWQDFEQRLGHRLLPFDKAPRFVVKGVEGNLASIIGAVSAHRSIDLVRRQQPVQIEDFVSLMGGSSRQLQFSQELLQTTLETIPQGISVVDERLQLVAWNSRYQQQFDFPSRLLYVGCPIAKVYQFNAERGYLGGNANLDVDGAVARRLDLLKTGGVYKIERRLPNDLVIEIRGTPMVNGGYVTTYTDITEYQKILDELEKAKVHLEERVKERTAELSSVNQSLQQENELRARIEKELSGVHVNKSRFLAAASHDLLQPINAARLFVTTLQQKSAEGNVEGIREQINNIDGALSGAENLIDSMREIARLDSGKLVPRREHFAIDDLLQMLANEFHAQAQHSRLSFSCRSSKLWVYTDRHLLRRVLQNFLTNALRYTRRGKVLLGCRRKAGMLVIEVWDTGPGIADKDSTRIFEEFERLGETTGDDNQKGLGLGLSIANRMSQLLGHRLSFDSVLGVGSVFRIAVPVGEKSAVQKKAPEVTDVALNGLKVLCVDNELRILAGMQALLEQWGCLVTCVPNLSDAIQRWQHESPPDIVLADYHLDNEETGLDVLQALSYHWNCPLVAIVISANNSDELRKTVKQDGYLFLPKPVQPAALRAAMRRMSRNVKHL